LEINLGQKYLQYFRSLGFVHLAIVTSLSQSSQEVQLLISSIQDGPSSRQMLPLLQEQGAYAIFIVFGHFWIVRSRIVGARPVK
jgi:hypothetical protein